jgi:hypothetical protein
MSRPNSLHARISRLLLILASILLVANPVTQHIWTFDRFMHGGHDFETSALLIVAALCLVLVLAQRRQRVFDLIPVLLWHFRPGPSLSSERQVTVCPAGHRGAAPPGRECNLPLLI